MIDPRTQTLDASALDSPLPAAEGGLLVAGTRIDTYTVGKVIGQGGMGVVYLAEQDPLRRTVALKLVRPGRAAPELIRRFELEAHLLGRLVHHGIAQIYEAGVAKLPDGPRAYLAMEFVPGRPLTEYANAKLISIPERLRLFMQVCEAIQHAHTKGVIHRDLKPQNILVTDDGQAKVLDFGVARDIRADATHTLEGQLIGTVPYMSPEQVAGDPNEIDTRTDVYALGVILYELLTGRPPLDVAGKPIAEAARMIREQTPPRLSRIQRDYAGDIETIVAKALEKEKSRRYQSAGDFAADIERFLKNRPIHARPPSATYQFVKFCRRNKFLVFLEAVALLAIILGVVGIALQTTRAQHAERLAESRRVLAEQETAAARQQRERAEHVAEFLRAMLAAVDPEVAGNMDTTLLRTILDAAAERIEHELSDQPDVEVALRLTLGTTYRQIGRYEESEKHLRRALALTTGSPPRVAEPALLQNARHELAVLHGLQSRFDESIPELQALLAESRARGAAAERETADLLNSLGVLLGNMDRLKDAEAALREALDIRERVFGPHDPAATGSRNDLAVVLDAAGRHAEAEPYLRQVVEEWGRHHGQEHVLTFKAMDNLGMCLVRLGRFDEAEALFQKALAGETRVLGENHPDTLVVLNNLGFLYFNQKRYEDAERMFARVVPIRRKALGDDHVDLALCLNNLAKSREMLGDASGAETAYREALGIYRRALSNDHPLVAATLSALAAVLELQSKPDDARAALREAMEIRAKHAADAPLQSADATLRYGAFLRKRGILDEAEPLLLRAAEAAEKIADAPGDLLRTVADQLAQLYAARGNAAKAELWRARAESSSAASAPSENER